ncbi:MAG: hypothetical protein AAF629_33720, partial [Chloroflexota bacterium]
MNKLRVLSQISLLIGVGLTFVLGYLFLEQGQPTVVTALASQQVDFLTEANQESQRDLSTDSKQGDQQIPTTRITDRGLSSCISLIQNGNFEDDAQMSLWFYSSLGESVTRTSVPHYFGLGQSFSMLLPSTMVSGIPRNPWLYQTFTLPNWYLPPTIEDQLQLTAHFHLGINPEGSAEPDAFEISLLHPTDAKTVAGPVVAAQADETPTLVPPVINNNGWISKTVSLHDHLNLADYHGQSLRLMFSAPNSA